MMHILFPFSVFLTRRQQELRNCTSSSSYSSLSAPPLRAGRFDGPLNRVSPVAGDLWGPLVFSFILAVYVFCGESACVSCRVVCVLCVLRS
jgi:hypothetical protein